MDPERKGELTEAVVVAELKRREIAVSLPFGDNERYDSVIEAPGGELLRAQIKTGWEREETVQFKGYSQHTNATGHTYRGYTDGIDCFLVYAHEIERLFLVWVDEVRATMTIRVEEPEQRHDSTNWADDFAFDERWPPGRKRLRSTSGWRSPALEPVVALLEDRHVPFVTVSDEQYNLLACDDSGGRHALRACSGNVVRGRIRFDTVSDSGDIDAYCVHCSETGSTYLVPDDEFDESISLRVEEPDQPDASINWATEYEFDERWPL